MTFVTAFRHVSRPITGMIGTVHAPDFEKFEARIDYVIVVDTDEADRRLENDEP